MVLWIIFSACIILCLELSINYSVRLNLYNIINIIIVHYVVNQSLTAVNGPVRVLGTMVSLR